MPDAPAQALSAPPRPAAWDRYTRLAFVAGLERLRLRVNGAGRAERPGRSLHGPIGLEIGQEALNLAQLKRAPDGKLSLQASARLPHPADRDGLLAKPAAFKARLAEALRGQPFVGRRVVSALPAQAVRLLPVPYEAGGGRGDAAAIAQALRERLDEDLSRFVIDYMPVRADAPAGDRLALVAVARREAVIEHLELLRRAGLEVAALEIGPSAIKRLISALAGPGVGQNHLVINFGADTSYLTVVSGRRLLQDQKVDFGERELLARIGQALQVSPQEARAWVARYGLRAAPAESARAPGHDADLEAARTLVEIVKPRLLRLVDEINRVLIYTASETHGGSVGQLHLLGSLARWSGIEALLSAMVEIPVRVLDNPLGLFGGDAADTDRGQALAIATGLALRGVLDDE